MTKNLKILVGLLSVVLVLSLASNYTSFRSNRLTDSQINDLKFQRDSIIQFSIVASKSREKVFKSAADSLIFLNKNLSRADSINHYKNNHEKAKIRFYTPDQRNHVYDSIFGPGVKISNSTR